MDLTPRENPVSVTPRSSSLRGSRRLSLRAKNVSVGLVGLLGAMLIGLVASTFSTIFIATPVMLAWYHNKRPSFSIGK